jgi:hypothetical protein
MKTQSRKNINTIRSVREGALLFISMLAIMIWIQPAKAEVDARTIMQKSQDMRILDAAEGSQTLTIYNSKGQKRVRKIAMVSSYNYKQKSEKRLIRFLAPADVKGTGLLTYDYKEKDDDIWLYLPSLRKTRRIVSSEKAKSFMGSEFSYADINMPTLDDFNFKVRGEETLEDVSCWIIETMPKNEDIADEYGFSKRLSYIGKEDYSLRKAIYYDLDGELHKELIARDIRKIDPAKNRYRAMHMKMVNKQDGRSSTVEFHQLQLSLSVKETYFTTRYLERQ